MTVEPEERPLLKISNSEIQTLKDCPRKWYLIYYRELAPKHDDMTGPLALGTKIHTVLEAIYRDDDEDPIAILGELYADDRAKAEDSPFAEEFLKALDKEHDLAHAMVEGFVQWRAEEGIDADYEVVSLESVLEAKISEAPKYEHVRLRAKLDQQLRRKSDGAILFNDWKTTQTFRDRWQLQLNEQMKTYMLLQALALKEGQHADGALYTMIRKVKRTAAAKPPFYKREEVRHNKAELESFYWATLEMFDRILDIRARLDAGEPMQRVVPPRPSRDCDWKCRFKLVCPMFDDGSRVEAALEENYRHMDPHERYSKEETKGASDD